MKRKSAQVINTRTGDYVHFHMRLSKVQYEKLWDMADENNTDISSLVKQAIDFILAKRDMVKKDTSQQVQ